MSETVGVGRSTVGRCDSTPAWGWPACRAVNLATVADVFIPVANGLATISNGGLLPFSKTLQV